MAASAPPRRPPEDDPAYGIVPITPQQIPPTTAEDDPSYGILPARPDTTQRDVSAGQTPYAGGGAPPVLPRVTPENMQPEVAAGLAFPRHVTSTVPHPAPPTAPAFRPGITATETRFPAAPPSQAAEISRQLQSESVLIHQEQRNLKQLFHAINGKTTDQREIDAYQARVAALQQRQTAWQALNAHYQSLPAGQTPLIRPLQYHPTHESATMQQLLQAQKQPDGKRIGPILDGQLGIAHAALARTFPARSQQLEHDGAILQQQDQALAALAKKADKGELSPSGVAALNRAIRQHTINVGAFEMTRYNLQQEGARFSRFIEKRGSKPLFPLGQFPEEAAGLGPPPTFPEQVDAAIDRLRHFLTPVASSFERANLPRAILALQYSGQYPPLPPLPPHLHPDERSRLIREKNDLSRLVDEEAGNRPIDPRTLTPWQQQLLPVLRQQLQAMIKAREIAGINKGALIDVGAQTAAFLLGGAVGGRVESALAGRLAPFLFRGIEQPALVGPAEVAARLFVARGLPRIAGQTAASATAGATVSGLSAFAVGPQKLDKQGRPVKPSLAERAAFAGKAAAAAVPLSAGLGAVVGATSFTLGTAKVLLSSHWSEAEGPQLVQLLTQEAERRAAASGAPLSAEESGRFGQRVASVLRAPLAAKPTGWRALAREWNQYLRTRLAAAPGEPGAPGGAPEVSSPPPFLGPIPGSAEPLIVGPTATVPSGVSFDLRTRPPEDIQQALTQFGQLKAAGGLTAEQEAHYALLSRFADAHARYQAQQVAPLATPEATEAVHSVMTDPTKYGRSGLADLDREIEALTRQGNDSLAGRLAQARTELLETITQALNRHYLPPGHPLADSVLPPVQASVLRTLTPAEQGALPGPVRRILTLADLNNSNAVLDPQAAPSFILPVGVKNDKDLRRLADNHYQLASGHLALLFPEPQVVPTAARAGPQPVTEEKIQPGAVIGFPNGFVVRITGPGTAVGPGSIAGAVGSQYPGIVLEQGHSPHAAGTTTSLLGQNLLSGHLLDPAQYPEALPSPTTPAGTPTSPTGLPMSQQQPSGPTVSPATTSPSPPTPSPSSTAGVTPSSGAPSTSISEPPSSSGLPTTTPPSETSPQPPVTQAPPTSPTSAGRAPSAAPPSVAPQPPSSAPSINEPRPLTPADLAPGAHIRAVTTGIDYRLIAPAGEQWHATVLTVPAGAPAGVTPGVVRSIHTASLLQPGRFLFIPEEEPTDAGARSNAPPTAAEPGPIPASGLGGAVAEPEPAAPPQGPHREPAPVEAPPQPAVATTVEAMATGKPFEIEGYRFGKPGEDHSETGTFYHTRLSAIQTYAGEGRTVQAATIRANNPLVVAGDQRALTYSPEDYPLSAPTREALSQLQQQLLARIEQARLRNEGVVNIDLILDPAIGPLIRGEGYDAIVYRKLKDEAEIVDLSEVGGLAPEKATASPFPVTPEEKLPRPFLNLVGALLARINEQMTADEPIFANNIALEAFAAPIMGGSRAAGTYNAQTIYNALEAAVNLFVAQQQYGRWEGGIDAALDDVRDLLKLLPTQTLRAGAKDENQQFSTPPTYALLAAWALQTKPGESLLEPSAGTGSLLAMAQSVWIDHLNGAVANEIDPERRAILRTYFAATAYGVDARYLHSLLPHDLSFDLVLMNPPFSSAPGQRARNTNEIGFDHVTQALSRLKPGGRLVAILGRGAAIDRPTAQPFWKKVQDKYTVRANVPLPGEDYAKYGTGFESQLVVIDNTGPTLAQPIYSEGLKTIEAVIEAFHERGITKREPTPAGEAPAPGGGRGGPEPTTGGQGRGGGGGGRVGAGAPVVSQPGTGTTGPVVGGGLPGPAPGEGEATQPAPGGEPAPAPVSGTTPAPTERAKPPGHVEPVILPRGEKQYHGSSQGVTLGLAYEREQHKNLFGPGFYTTDNPGVAQTYTKKGKGKEPSVYEVQWLGAVPPKLLDLDQPIPADLQPYFQEQFRIAEALDFTRPGRDVYKELKDGWAADGLTTGEAEEEMQAIVDHLTSLGYDGMEHTGGVGRKTGLHHVIIYFHPVDEQTGQPNLALVPIGAAAPTLPVAEPAPKPATKKAAATEPVEAEERIDVGDQYVSYLPTYVFEGRPHPATMVETRSLAAVDPPPLTVTHSLKKQALYPDKQLAEQFATLTGNPVPNPDDLGISHLQLEAALYAKQRHQVILPNGTRAGFLLGDSTGAGKGRSLASIAADGWENGVRRIVWLSSQAGLAEAARDDLAAIGYGHIPVVLATKIGGSEPIDPNFEGIIFSTYAALVKKPDKGTLKGRERREQLEQWMNSPKAEGGEDTQGEGAMILMDESHALKNAIKLRGGPEPGPVARAGLKIQHNLPKARIVYSSATAMTDLENMAYLTRLGVWGEGTPWADFSRFGAEMGGGGRGYMEMVARDMKARGNYLSREISYQDPEGRPEQSVEFRTLTHELDANDQRLYNIVAQAWQLVLQNFEAAVEITGDSFEARKKARGDFWSGHQRFFRQFLTSLKLPSLYADIDKQLAAGRSVIISLTGTGEAAEDRAVQDAIAAGVAMEDLDLTPIQALRRLVEKSFPVQMYQDKLIPGTRDTESVAMFNEDKQPILNPDAVAARDALMERLAAITEKMPGNPLNEILFHYGHDNVAELTGRDERLQPGPDGKIVRRSRGGASINDTEMERFNSGEKRIALISKAANQGISLHAGRRFKNQQRRVQYMLELNWSADQQMQANGRSHRSNQVSAPELVIVNTNAGGETRFAATIARRLASLGALTRGERGATGAAGALDQFDFENDYGKAALLTTYQGILLSGSVPGLANARQALRDMGVLVADKRSGAEMIASGDERNITRFMNRLLSLEVERQNPIFEAFAANFARNVKNAQDSGDFDFGVEDIRGANIREEGQAQVVHTDPQTGAITVYHHVVADEPVHPVTLQQIDHIPEEDRVDWFVRDRDNKVFYGIRSFSMEHPTRLLNPHGREPEYVTSAHLRERYTPIRALDKIVAARRQWQEDVEKVPKTRPVSYHLVVGSILPIFDRLKSSGQKYFGDRVRRATLPNGRRIVGISLAPQYYKRILQALGATAAGTDTAGLYERLYAGEDLQLVSGVKLRRALRSGNHVVLIEGLELDQIRELGEGPLRFPYERNAATYRHAIWISSDPSVGVPQLEYLLNRFPPMESARGSVQASGQGRKGGEGTQSTGRIVALPIWKNQTYVPVVGPSGWSVPKETQAFLDENAHFFAGIYRSLAEMGLGDSEAARISQYGLLLWPEIIEPGEAAPSWLSGLNETVTVAAPEGFQQQHVVSVNPFPPQFDLAQAGVYNDRGQGTGYRGLKEADNPNYIASQIINTMIHELAHLRVWEEGEPLARAISELYSTIGNDRLDAVEEAITHAITDISGRLSAGYRRARQAYYAKAGADRRPSPVGGYQGQAGPGRAVGQIVGPGGPGGQPPAPGDRGAVARRRRGGEGHREGIFTLSDPGAEAQFTGARPTQEPPLEWFKRASTDLGHFLARVYPHLPANDARYAELRYRLLEMEKGWHIATTNAVLILKQTLDDLSKADYSFFQRAVYVLDLEEEVSRQVTAITDRLGVLATPEMIDRQMKLPQGDGSVEQAWTAHKVGDEALIVRREMEKPQSRAVVEAMEIRRHLLDGVKDRLLTEMEKATGRTRVMDREEYFHHEMLFWALETMHQRGGGRPGSTPPVRSFQQRRVGSLLNYDSNFVSAETAWLVPAIFDTMLYELMSFIRDEFNIKKELQKAAVWINDHQIMEFFQALADEKNARMKAGRAPVTAKELYRARLNGTMAQGFFRLGKMANESPEMLPGHDDDRWNELIEQIGVNWEQNQDAMAYGEEELPLVEEYFRQLFQYLTWLLQEPQAGQPGSGAAATIFKGIRDKRAIIKQELGSRHVTWKQLLHTAYNFEGKSFDFREYTTWMPEKGNALHRAWSVRDRIANSVIEAGTEGLRVQLKEADLKRLLVLGGRKPEWVIPKIIADTLTEFKNPHRDEFDRNVSKIGSGLKEWILLNPEHWFSYVFRNEFTDLEVVGGFHPYALQYMWRAMLELGAFMYQRELPGDDLREWLDKGGITATLLAANTGRASAGTLEMLRHLRDKQTLNQKTFGRFWKTLRITNDYREAILRYAAYLSYRDQIINEGIPRNYGASNKDEIDALPNPQMKAWALSNELLGAYDQVPPFFKKVRGVMPMPFLTWKIVNTRREYRLFVNEFATSGGYEALLEWMFDQIADEDNSRRDRLKAFLKGQKALPAAGGGGAAAGGGGGAGTGGGGDGLSDEAPEDDDRERTRRAFSKAWRQSKGKKNRLAYMLALMGIGPVAAAFMARWLMKSLWMDWLAIAYNNTFHREEEEAMPPYARFTPHLDWGHIPGTNLYGYLDRISGVGDAFGTFGIDDIMGYREKVNSGRWTKGQVVYDMFVRSPFQTLVDQVGFPRFAAELLTKRELFPNVEQPRDIRDRVEHTFKAMGMGRVYLAIRGIPQRGGPMAIGLGALPMNVFQAGESQYDESRELSIDWATKNGFWDSHPPSEKETGKLAYMIKRSLKFGDQTSALHFTYLYWEAGGDEDGLHTSLKSTYPLLHWPDVQRTAFLRSLTFAEQQRWRNGLWFLQQTVAHTAEFSPGEKQKIDELAIEEFDDALWAKIEIEIDSQDFFKGYDKEHFPKGQAKREKVLEALGK